MQIPAVFGQGIARSNSGTRKKATRIKLRAASKSVTAWMNPTELGTRRRDRKENMRGGHMFYWSLVFLLMAIIAGLVGLGAFVAAGIAKLLFAAFGVLFLVSFVAHLARMRPQ
jgi:uncharacterized membrane protein YtjA (UPF0391 family)